MNGNGEIDRRIGDQELSDRTADLLGLCDVHRWTVIKTGRHQTVAEHSFAVAIIAMELCDRLGVVDVESSHRTLLWSLIHDVPETLTGDIDGKFKRDFPEARAAICEAEDQAFPWYRAIANITPTHIRWIVKVADTIEALAFIRQWGVGSRADDICRELEKILATDRIPVLEAALRAVGWGGNPDPPDVEAEVYRILNHSTGDEHSIQMRRFRKGGAYQP